MTTRAMRAMGIVIGVTLVASAVSAGTFPTWDRQKAGASRFKILTQFASEAVLDKETGLVWEAAPEPSTTYVWSIAFYTCLNKTVGNRKGWRLPTAEELGSLVDPSLDALAAGHPFTVTQGRYFSATTDPSDTSRALARDLPSGANDGYLEDKTNPNRYWCVRGGRGHDGGQ